MTLITKAYCTIKKKSVIQKNSYVTMQHTFAEQVRPPILLTPHFHGEQFVYFGAEFLTQQLFDKRMALSIMNQQRVQEKRSGVFVTAQAASFYEERKTNKRNIKKYTVTRIFYLLGFQNS